MPGADANTTTNADGTKKVDPTIVANANGADGDDPAKAKGDDPTDTQADLEKKWDSETKDYIKSLRTENAKARNDKKDLNTRLTNLEKGLKSALGLETELPAEKQIETLKQKTELQNFRAAILEAAIDNGIGKDDVDYFQYLVEKEASKLDEGDELSADAMKEIVKRVKKQSGGAASNTTSIVDKKQPNADGNPSTVSVEQFAKMSITEKSQMYTKNPDQYAALMSDAKAKRLIV